MASEAAASAAQQPVLSWWARVVVAITYLTLLSVDPLNIGTASSQRSEDAVLRISAAYYDASREVTVVLIDDDYLRKIGSGWPMSYRAQGLLLRRLLSYEPSAVFVDLLYRQRYNQEPSVDSPADLLAALPRPPRLRLPAPRAASSEALLPALIFAGLSTDATKLSPQPGSFCYPDGLAADQLRNDPLLDTQSIDPTLQTLVAAPSDRAALGVALVGWSGCGSSYPLLLAGSRAAPTPAYAMYRAFCSRHGLSERCADQSASRQLRAPGGEDTDVDFVRPLIVRWGTFAPGFQKPFYAAGSCQRATRDDGEVGPLPRFAQAFQQLALGAIFDVRTDAKPEISRPCPAVPVIRADALLDGDPRALGALLRDKAVFLGASVAGVPDWYTSPVHGRIPGVVLHAMALDNLLTAGPRYAKRMHSQVSDAIRIGLALLVAFVAPWFLLRRQRLLGDRVPVLLGLGLWIGYSIYLAVHGLQREALGALAVGLAFDLIKPTDTLRYTLLIALMALLALLALASGWSPWNWIGLLLVIVATTETMKGFLKASAPKPFPHPDSLLGALFARMRAAIPFTRGTQK